MVFKLAWALFPGVQPSLWSSALRGARPGAGVLALGALDPLGHALVRHSAHVALVQDVRGRRGQGDLKRERRLN